MIVILMTVLSLGNVLNAGFDQIQNLISPQVYATGDILDTFIYRIAMLDAQPSTQKSNTCNQDRNIQLMKRISLYWFFHSFIPYPFTDPSTIPFTKYF